MVVASNGFHNMKHLFVVEKRLFIISMFDIIFDYSFLNCLCFLLTFVYFFNTSDNFTVFVINTID